MKESLLREKIVKKDACPHCKEAAMPLWSTTPYGSVIIYRIGKSEEDGWFATISPKTGSDVLRDFTIQLMSTSHYSHFSQISVRPELAKNFGIAFARMNEVMTRIIGKNEEKIEEDSKENALSLAIYGKCTNWKEKKEHLHIKIFPFNGDLSQPFTVDSTFGKKEVFIDKVTNEKYVKMRPVMKKEIPKDRFQSIINQLRKELS